MCHRPTDRQAVIHDWDVTGDAIHAGIADIQHADFVGRRGTLRVELETHDNIPHHYRHDLEALLWASPWSFSYTGPPARPT